MTTLLDRLPARWPVTGRRELIERCLARLADRATAGILLRGEMGTGKTRVCSEIASSLEQRGTPVLRITAGPTLHEIAGGALAQVGGAEGLERFATEASNGLLVVDDVQELDRESAAVIARMIEPGEGVRLLATARSGAVIDEAITARWRAGDVLAVEVTPLSRQSMSSLLHRVCGGPVDADAEQQLWELTHGNPLFLRELVMGSIADERFAPVDGVWTVRGQLQISPMLRDVVSARAAALPEPGRHALDLLAVSGGMGMADLEREVGTGTIEALEAGGWIRVEESQRRLTVRGAHPVYEEVLRAQQSRVRLRELARAHVARVEGHGSRRASDALMVARWRLDAEGQAPVEVLLAGAREARNDQDHAQVEQLARAALLAAETDADRTVAGQLLGDALFELGSFAEAEVVLAAADGRADDDSVRLQIALQRVNNAFWGSGDLERAQELNERALAELSGDRASALRANEAAVALYAGRVEPALALADEGSDDNGYERAAFDAVASVALTMVGDTDRALAVAARGAEAHASVGDLLATAHPGIHVVNRGLALSYAGRWDEAEQLARAGWDFSVRERAVIGQIWFASQLGGVALHRGRPAEAARWFEQQVMRCNSSGHRLQMHLAYIGLGLAAGARRDADGADDAAQSYGTSQVDWFGLFVGEAARARAWRAVAHGRVVEAVSILEEVAPELAGASLRSQEAAVLHDAVRISTGDVGPYAERLRELAAETTSPLIAVYAADATARAERDLDGLRASADDLLALGANLLAAETVSVAAHEALRAGHPRKATALRNEVAELRETLEGADTPGLLHAPDAVALTPRERQVATLAASGVASKDIAAELFLSVRTVENHLQRVYTKFGVTNRAELRAAVGSPE
jgi:DNA-binding NarL/FixJ family response regulator